MNTFFTSDVHFGHTNILKYCPARGQRWSSVDEMNEGLIERWNSTIGPNDLVYNLGDFFFCREPQAIEILNRLNGRIRLIYGNHDNVIRNSRALRDHPKFEWLRDYHEERFGSVARKVVLFHYPIASWNGAHHESWHLHGHTHGSFPPSGRRVDVGIDSEFITGSAEHRPFSLDELVEYMRHRKHEPVDHHM